MSIFEKLQELEKNKAENQPVHTELDKIDLKHKKTFTGNNYKQWDIIFIDNTYAYVETNEHDCIEAFLQFNTAQEALDFVERWFKIAR